MPSTNSTSQPNPWEDIDTSGRDISRRLNFHLRSHDRTSTWKMTSVKDANDAIGVFRVESWTKILLSIADFYLGFRV